MKTRLYLTRDDAGRELSIDEFLDAEFAEGHKYEIIEGRLDVSPEAGFPHGHLRTWLFLALHAYSSIHPEVINHVLPGGRVFVPGRDGAPRPRSPIPSPTATCRPIGSSARSIGATCRPSSSSR